MIGKTVSHYEITEQLGRGGMGIVYKAIDTKLKRPVALKFLPAHLSSDQDAKNRFIQEAQAASALDHANICTIYEIGETSEPGAEPEVYIAMAYYAGQTLKYRLESEDFTPERAADIARQLASALGRAHEEGIVHRDVKPANIMLTDRSEVKLLDFGLAKLLGGAELTHAGSTLGTAGYMSPEQVKGDEITPASDLWSLGVVLYEMLAGKKPFSGDYEQAAMYAILNETPEDLGAIDPSLPSEVVELVNRCLAKDPAGRPQSASEIQQAIVASGLCSGSGSQTVIGSVPQRRTARPSWLLPAVSITTLAILAVMAIVLWPAGSDPETHVVIAPDPAIAVLPFSVGGDASLDYLRNGMVRLLSTRFDGMGEIRSIDPNALLVQPELEGEGEIDPSLGNSLAARFNAENYIIGSVLRVGGPIQVSANMYDRDGTSVGYSEVAIAADSLLLTAVDQVARELLADKFEGPADAMASMAIQSTSSFDALRDYLRGEELMHAGRFNDAKPFLRSAIDRDSTFALAWLRFSDAYAWTNWDDETYLDASRRALELSSRLPPVYRERLQIEQMLRSGNFESAITRAERLHQRHPEDVETLLLLGDYQWHYNGYYGKPANDSEQYFRDILRIDPGLAEAKFHLVEILIRTGRYAEADSLAGTTDSEQFEGWGRTASLAAAAGPDTATTNERLREMLADIDDQVTAWLAGSVSDLAQRPDVARRLVDLFPHVDLEPVEGVIAEMSGQFESELGSLRAGGETNRNVLAVLLSFYPFSEGDLDRIAARMDAPLDTSGLFRAPHADIVEASLPAIQVFHRALVDWRRSDVEALERHRLRLRSMQDTDPDNLLAASYERLLDALLLWNTGDIEGAERAFRESVVPVPIRLTTLLSFNLAINRFLHGRMLFEAGRYNEAIRWLSAVDDGFLRLSTGSRLFFPAMYMRAQSHEQLGQTDQAIQLYTNFVRAWEEADPALQAMVEDARARIDALALATTREPAG